MENNYDFIAVGDIVIDAFIKLKDAHIHSKIDTDTEELCVGFGAKIPYESVTIIPAVGNSPNAAVAAARLGLKTGLITNVGDDRHGNECLEMLKKNSVETEHVTIEKGKNTNYHYVLWYHVDRTILVKHTEFDYKFPNPENVSWIYLSSLADNSLPYHLQIAEYLKNNPETKLAFQPGTFQIKLGTEKLKDIYAHTEIFFCNAEEAETILAKENTSQNKDIKVLAKGIHALGPKIVVITDGLKGSYAYSSVGTLFMPPYPDPKPPYERTGAGDAFSSTVVCAIILDKTLPEALAWGSINAMSVVQYVGAQEGLLSRPKLEDYLKDAPEDFKARKM